MGIFDKFLKKEEIQLQTLENISDDDIVAMYDGELFDVSTLTDPVFAKQIMGKSVAFKTDKNKIILCSPANGTLSVLYPTGHAFCVAMNNGVELLIHCGIDSVNANGGGFRLLDKKQGDLVKAGDPIVEADLAKLSKKYDMSTILIILNENDKQMDFIEPQLVTRGQSLIR